MHVAPTPSAIALAHAMQRELDWATTGDDSMKTHEYQAKQILRISGVKVPRGILATSPLEAEDAARQLGSDVLVVKAQIHAGGRGKAGGVKVARSPADAGNIAERILGTRLKTAQTGAEGQEVRKVYVEEGCRYVREIYLGMTLDRGTARVTLMASSDGGVEIEEVAKAHPERILKMQVDPIIGLSAFQARRLAYGLGLSGEAVREFARFATALYDAYLANDATLAEINPLAITDAGQVVALDAKMAFDDNALWRHPRVAAMRDPWEEDPREGKAREFDLQYVALDGDIGCMVNGAGLAMATMDVIRLSGGRPANFLDVGGGADEKKVTEAFKLLLSDAHVRVVLVNIFGGIMKCDVIANGIVAAARQVQLSIPLVVRLEGTNMDQGKRILAESGLRIVAADDLGDAARKAVAAAAREGRAS